MHFFALGLILNISRKMFKYKLYLIFYYKVLSFKYIYITNTVYEKQHESIATIISTYKLFNNIEAPVAINITIIKLNYIYNIFNNVMNSR